VDPIIGFVEKQLSAPCLELSSVQMVTDFLASRTDRKHALSTVMVVRTCRLPSQGLSKPVLS
jgi:hypothetical protein